MDQFISGFAATPDQDLMQCHGVAYQRDMQHKVSYDAAYFDKCRSYEDKEIAVKINAGRIAMVNKYVGPEATVIDIGIGSGEFIRKRGATFGHDINPRAVTWLKRNKLWIGEEELSAFEAFTFWDVIEHVEDPNHYFRHIDGGGYLFTSLPIFEDLSRVRESKHYRPGEHLYYWTEQGFVDWMAMYRFRLLERQDFEIKAGRESILSFAFRRDFMT